MIFEWLFYRRRAACYACGKPGRPCPGHEYGGTIYVRIKRRPWRWLP